MRMDKLFAATTLLALPTLAFAGLTPTVPEPETLALLGIGAVALVIARWRKKK